MKAREVYVVVGSDEHGFVIEGAVPSLHEEPAVVDNTLVGWWPDRDPSLSGFIVHTGSQWGPFGVVLRVLDSDPGAADERWQDVVEVSVDVAGSVWLCEIVDGPVGDVDCPKGTYRMRIAALGRTESAGRDIDLDDEEDDEAPLEHYLIELWPATEQPARVVREESQYAKEQIDPPVQVSPAVDLERGLTAAWALVRDLRGERGARPLPGELSALSLSLELTGTKAKLFVRLRYAIGWPPCEGGVGSSDAATDYYDATLPEYTGAYEQAGSIVITLVDAEKPNRVVRRWNWITTPGPLDRAQRLLPSDSTVTLTFTKINTDNHEPRTLVHLTHEGIPRSWVNDLQALWTWDLVNRARS